MNVNKNGRGASYLARNLRACEGGHATSRCKMLHDTCEVEALAAALGRAFDARSIQSHCAPWTGLQPVLFATPTSLLAAVRSSGRGARPRAILAALAEAQGAGSAPGERAPWERSPGAAANILRAAGEEGLRRGASHAHPFWSAAFLNTGGWALLVPGTLAATASASIEARLRATAMHEVGHVIERRLRLNVPCADIEVVPPRRPLPGGVGDMALREAASSHARESFAETFACAAALSMGASVASIWDTTAADAWCLDAGLSEWELGEGGPRAALHRATYCTLPAVSFLLRSPPSPGTGASATLAAARWAARRGALPADILLDVGSGAAPPWMLEQFDTVGAWSQSLSNLRARAALRPEGIDLRAVRRILGRAGDPASRYLLGRALLAEMGRSGLAYAPATREEIARIASAPLEAELSAALDAGALG